MINKTVVVSASWRLEFTVLFREHHHDHRHDGPTGQFPLEPGQLVVGGVCGKDQLPRENGHQPVMMRAEVSDWPSYLATRRGDCGAPGENSVSRVLDVEPGEE